MELNNAKNVNQAVEYIIDSHRAIAIFNFFILNQQLLKNVKYSNPQGAFLKMYDGVMTKNDYYYIKKTEQKLRYDVVLRSCLTFGIDPRLAIPDAKTLHQKFGVEISDEASNLIKNSRPYEKFFKMDLPRDFLLFVKQNKILDVYEQNNFENQLDEQDSTILNQQILLLEKYNESLVTQNELRERNEKRLESENEKLKAEIKELKAEVKKLQK